MTAVDDATRTLTDPDETQSKALFFKKVYKLLPEEPEKLCVHQCLIGGEGGDAGVLMVFHSFDSDEFSHMEFRYNGVITSIDAYDPDFTEILADFLDSTGIIKHCTNIKEVDDTDDDNDAAASSSTALAPGDVDHVSISDTASASDIVSTTSVASSTATISSAPASKNYNEASKYFPDYYKKRELARMCGRVCTCDPTEETDEGFRHINCRNRIVNIVQMINDNEDWAEYVSKFDFSFLVDEGFSSRDIEAVIAAMRSE